MCALFSLLYSCTLCVCFYVWLTLVKISPISGVMNSWPVVYFSYSAVRERGREMDSWTGCRQMKRSIEESFYIGSKISQPGEAELAYRNTQQLGQHTHTNKCTHTLILPHRHTSMHAQRKQAFFSLSVYPSISICLAFILSHTQTRTQPTFQFSPLFWPCHRQFQLVVSDILGHS